MRKARVLIVDDERAFLGMLVMSVQLLGYEAVGVESAESALLQAADFAPDLVLADVRLPGMDGPALIESLRKEARLASIPILLMSAYGRPVSDTANGFLHKPFDIDDLEWHFRRLFHAGNRP